MKISPFLPLVVGSAAGILASSAFPAQALVFNVGGTDYDITTTTDTYDNISSTLQSQPWWGISNLADQLAQAVGTQLGTPNTDDEGDPVSPLFAYNFPDPDNLVNGYYSPATNTFTIFSDTPYTYAIVSTPVPFDIPGGATIPTVGSLFALALMRTAKKRMAFKTAESTISTVIS
ncbi:hypothetical protein [Anabaena lutea]|uniref:PEP-CTERM sorting domain-containing protein n=1 Tax=Anabaena lutea FACHB-196 TaxID=2692881 RepID=A0ABR8F8R7_9NOST|nr:hypothetical protein [Anabaena lutea]MBD2566446.1 hypothetical protein [Anabaena lutea FACHB-196]